MSKRTAILIVGMHRSGTSAVARVTSILGATLPKRVLGPREGNPTGHWEPLELVNLHDRLLGAASSAWFDVRRFDPTKIDDRGWIQFNIEIVRLIQEEYEAAAFFVIKDPRVCRLVPVWRKVLDAARIRPAIVIPYRHPLEVALSLRDRDGMDVNYAALLWLRHVLDAERDTRDLARAFISFDLLLDDWRGGMEAVRHWCGVDLDIASAPAGEAVDRFLSRELRHHVNHAATVVLSPGLRRLAERVYAALEQLRHDPSSAAARGDLDGAYEVLTQACALFGDAAFNEIALWRRRERDLQRVSQEHSSALEALAAADRERALAYQGEAAAQTQRAIGAEAAVAAIEQRAAAAEQTLADVMRSLADVQASLAAETERNAQIDAALKLQEAAYEQALSVARNRHAEMTRALESTNLREADTATSLHKVLASKERTLSQLNRLHDDMAKQERRHRAAVEELERQLRNRDAQLRAFANSRSWRFTKPLRATAQMARRHVIIRKLVPAQPAPEGTAAAEGEAQAAAKFRSRITGWLKPSGRRDPVQEEAPAPSPPPVTLPLVPRFLTTHPEIDPACELRAPVSVSVVIPTYNAGPEFGLLLRKLKMQKGLKSIEIVIIDSSSTDDTAKIAEAAGCIVRVIEQKSFTHSFARNLGADSATGDFLLFMVQDAYPVGTHWASGLAQVLTDPNAEKRLSAVSAVEFPRADADLLYAHSIDSHYTFLGCLGRDRVGKLAGNDHHSLRTQGQLSDVACMISTALFREYRFQGRYAEDLRLGTRLVQDGHSIGMLSSIKVIHSHNRPANYYLRRSFTDILFLAEAFADYPLFHVRDIASTFHAAREVEKLLARALPETCAEPRAPEAILGGLAAALRDLKLDAPGPLEEAPPDFGLRPFAEWSAGILAARRAQPERAVNVNDALQFRADYVSRLEHLRKFVAAVYPSLDATVYQQIRATTEKLLASSVGIYVGFAVLVSRAKLTEAVSTDEAGAAEACLTRGI